MHGTKLSVRNALATLLCFGTFCSSAIAANFQYRNYAPGLTVAGITLPQTVTSFTNYVGPATSIIPDLTSNNSYGFDITYSSLWPNGPYWQGYFPFSTAVPPNGGYMPESTGNQWLKIAMPQATKISRIDLNIWCSQFASYTAVRQSLGLPRNFVIEVSSDGNTWTQVVSVSDFNYDQLAYASNSYARFEFAPVTAKYIRYSQTAYWAGSTGWDRGYLHTVKIG